MNEIYGVSFEKITVHLLLLFTKRLVLAIMALVVTKDTNRKIRKTKFIYICGSKNGSSSSAVKTGED